MSRLEGKVAIVTGASRGIGYAVAQLFADHGATVVATSLTKRDPYRGDVHFETLDVAQDEDWKRVTALTLDRFGGIDVLVNNAGIIVYEPAHELDHDGWDKVVAVNQTGVWLGMRSVIPHMLERGNGSIINISSIWGSAAVAGGFAYHATKGAVRNMSKNVAITYAEQGIRCNSVHPGFIDTPLTQSQDQAINDWVVNATPMKRAGLPVEIAYGCLYLASDEAKFVTGSELVIDGGYLAQ
ncbi:MAG: glucose 1-dehydrogenase [Actinomycetota bacterium]|nr:glucose 1-dehydrogenase [Actinomycetota bacterium]